MRAFGGARAWRSARGIGFAAGSLVLTLAAGGRDAAARDAVLVELYTSQGCYLCPPADALLGELAARDDVAALTLNVDYWDYIGWKDRLAQPIFAKRQRAYAIAHNQDAVGTPSIVVHGVAGMPGGRRAGVFKAVAKAAAATPPAHIALRRAGGTLQIEVASEEDAIGGMAAVMAAPYRGPVTQAIEAGENAGKSVTYHNTVLALHRLGGWSGGDARFDLDLPQEAEGVAVWIQRMAHGRPVGPVLAAAKIDF